MQLKFTKKYGKDYVLIEENHEMSNDDWFLNVNWINNKTKKITYASIIIKKDLKDWIIFLENNHYKFYNS